MTTTYGYDSNGNQTTIAAPLSRNTTNAYDPLNRLSQITDPGSCNTYLKGSGIKDKREDRPSDQKDVQESPYS